MREEPRISLTEFVDVVSSSGVSENQIEETKAALRELGLNDDVKTD